jgi:uncharacterized protein YfdQ (DUF2303 family)
MNDLSTTNDSGVAALLNTATTYAAGLTEPHQLTEDATVAQQILPPGYSRVEIDLEKYAANPRRARGQVVLEDTASFVEYVNRFASDAAIAYVSIDGPRVDLRLDDHAPTTAATVAPGWAEWKTVLAWRPSLLWAHWLGGNNKFMDQEHFAEHVEEGARSIVEPDASTLLEIAQTFKAQQTSQIAIARRLQSGELKFEWNESIDARAGRGDDEITIPDKITLLLAPFEGAERIHVEARLRFRLGSGSDKKLTLGYLLDNPRQILRDAVDREVGILREQLHPAVTLVYGQRS